MPLSVANENRLHKTVAQCLTPSWPGKTMQELPSGDCWQFTGAGICIGRRAGSSRRDGVGLANTVERRELAAPRVYVLKKRRVARDKAGQASNKFEVNMFWRKLLLCVANGEADIDPFSACDLGGPSKKSWEVWGCTLHAGKGRSETSSLRETKYTIERALLFKNSRQVREGFVKLAPRHITRRVLLREHIPCATLADQIMAVQERGKSVFEFNKVLHRRTKTSGLRSEAASILSEPVQRKDTQFSTTKCSDRRSCWRATRRGGHRRTTKCNCSPWKAYRSGEISRPGEGSQYGHKGHELERFAAAHCNPPRILPGTGAARTAPCRNILSAFVFLGPASV